MTLSFNAIDNRLIFVVLGYKQKLVALSFSTFFAHFSAQNDCLIDCLMKTIFQLIVKNKSSLFCIQRQTSIEEFAHKSIQLLCQWINELLNGKVNFDHKITSFNLTQRYFWGNACNSEWNFNWAYIENWR